MDGHDFLNSLNLLNNMMTGPQVINVTTYTVSTKVRKMKKKKAIGLFKLNDV